MYEIDTLSAIETNILKLGTMQMEACAKRLIVVQDPFVSGYECTTCGGKKIINEVSYVDCPECGGRGKTSSTWNEQSIEKKCSACEGRGIVPCPECKGKGGLLIMPSVSERRPTTGTIASVGWEIDGAHWWNKLKFWLTRTRHYQRGESVIYPNFAGHTYDIAVQGQHGEPIEVTLVVLEEHEILARVTGHLELRRMRRAAALNTAA